jgi:hypothetical protein
MLLTEVGKFLTAFTAVVGTAALLWQIAAAEDAPRGTQPAQNVPAAAAVVPDAASRTVGGEVRSRERGRQGIDAEGLTVGVRMPFGAFAFGWELNRQ